MQRCGDGTHCGMNTEWRSDRIQNEALQPFFQRQLELRFHVGCLMWDSRGIVPGELRKQVLTQLCETHPGISSMKALSPDIVLKRPEKNI